MPTADRRPVTALDTEFGDAGDSPGLMLWRVTNSWQATQRAALQPFGLTHVQFVLLASLTYLRTDEVAVTQRDLADHARTDPMMTSQVVRALEQKDLVERGPHPTDARARSVLPTPRGRGLANDAVRAIETADRAFFAALGADAPRFTALLRRLDQPGHQPAGRARPSS